MCDPSGRRCREGRPHAERIRLQHPSWAEAFSLTDAMDRGAFVRASTPLAVLSIEPPVNTHANPMMHKPPNPPSAEGMKDISVAPAKSSIAAKATELVR